MIESEAAHVIVFGNEKGGSGKSTAAMHVAVALLRLGYSVGTIDLDARQATFTRYFRNRFEFASKSSTYIPMPLHMAITRSESDTVDGQQDEERNFFEMAIGELESSCDFVVIDTPGTDSFLSRLAHSYADTLLTPVNDSFVDLDLLADIDPDTHRIRGLSVYSKMVLEQQAKKKKRDGADMNWIVMRNRMTHINARNKHDIGVLLEKMALLFRFTLAPGFGERVVFKELFLKGLTLMDLKEGGEMPLTLSQLSARQEVRKLIMVLAPEKIKGYRKPPREDLSSSASGSDAEGGEMVA